MAPQSVVLQCVNVLSDRRGQWQELELSHRTSIRVKFSRVNRSASNALTSRSSKKKSGQDEEEDGMLDYDSPKQ